MCVKFGQAAGVYCGKMTATSGEHIEYSITTKQRSLEATSLIQGIKRDNGLRFGRFGFLCWKLALLWIPGWYRF